MTATINCEYEYQKLYDENSRNQDLIDTLGENINANKKVMSTAVTDRVKQIQTEFFADNSQMKIKINSAFDLKTVKELAALDPLKFVKKYITQEKPRLVRSQTCQYYSDTLKKERETMDKVFNSSQPQNAVIGRNVCEIAGPGVKITTRERDETDYCGRDYTVWADIILTFDGHTESLEYEWDKYKKGDECAIKIRNLVTYYQAKKRRR